MKKNEIKVGGLYEARVGGRYTTVRVDAIRDCDGWQRDVTRYDCTNLTTGRKVTFKSAAKFRREVTLADRKVSVETIEITPVKAAALLARPGEGIEETLERIEGEQRPDPTDTLNTSLSVQPVGHPGATATTASTEAAPSAVSEDATEAAPTTGRISKLVQQIAAANTAPKMGLTAQQEDILATARVIENERNNGQRVMVIGAGAGTGKTFTLKQLEQILSGNGQYTAFNSSLVSESKAKFSKAACNTTHSLAFRAVGKRYSHRLGQPRVKSHQIASALGIADYYVGLPASIQPPESDGRPATRRLKAAYLAGQVTEAVRKFCQSADRKLTTYHFSPIDGIDEAGSRVNSNKVKEYLLPYAEKAWADLSDENGTLPFSHDVYVKVWQLGVGNDRPVIAADYILLDEAQDTAPVMLDILQQQAHALLVLVGDDNQQIYEWRGATNAMKAFPKAARRLLSKSFRFGQVVADVANAVLKTLEEPTDLVMQGLETIPTRVCKVAEPRCYIYRTNAGAIGRMMWGRTNNKRGHLIGGKNYVRDLIKFCSAAIDLQNGVGTSHPELGCFANWIEVQDYSKEDEGADLRLMVKLIDDFEAEEIIDCLSGMPAEDKADFVVSTAHRSKGREWPSVKLGQDFPLSNKLSDADRRVVYVAATRGQEELDITECPTFCGGLDKVRGEDGEAQEVWIPGIPINYTIEMPTEADLAAYREAKAAAKPEKSVAAPISQPTPANTPVADPKPAAAQPAPANGNGQYSWANVEGGWRVRGPANQPIGARVIVVRRDGSRSTVTIGEVVKKLGDLWFYAVN